MTVAVVLTVAVLAAAGAVWAVGRLAEVDGRPRSVHHTVGLLVAVWSTLLLDVFVLLALNAWGTW